MTQTGNMLAAEFEIVGSVANGVDLTRSQTSEEKQMSGAAPTVFIVDDAPKIRTALSCLLAAAGYQVRAFESAECFLEERDCEGPGCLLLDFYLPGLSGLDLQRSLIGSARARPIIFLTGQGDIETSVQAMKLGAVDFLRKPIDDTRLLAAIDQAIRLDIAARRKRTICEPIQKRLQALSRRERQVMELVIRGRINREIALQLGVCEKTVKVHRKRVMKKMGVRSVAGLVQFVARVGVEFEFPHINAGKSSKSGVVYGSAP